MAGPDLKNEYQSHGNSVHDLFDSTEEGFFVPPYQREYTWEEDNVNQLFDDIITGVEELTNNDQVATFLGTGILTDIDDKTRTVVPGDKQAAPSAISIVIDGQQRISTLALLSIHLIERIRYLVSNLPKSEPYSYLHNHADDQILTLRKLHTVRIGRGSTPEHKPKIIRAQSDRWTHSGPDTHYSSPVAHYLAQYIRYESLQAAYDSLDSVTGARVRGNVDLIEKWLDSIQDAHVPGTHLHDQFPIGSKTSSDRYLDLILGFTDNDLRTTLNALKTDTSSPEYWATGLYQIFVFNHYLLRRAGINRLQPSNQEWGFDMFQALNSTGTPLTALETFLPQVMQAEETAGTLWENSPSKDSMDDIYELFENTTTNEQKNRRTNDLFGAFRLCLEGNKLGNKFSSQRRWISRVYEKELPTIGEKRQLISQFASVANFYTAAWYMESFTQPNVIQGFEENPRGEFASVLVQYLKEANSRLSAPILIRFYEQALSDPSRRDDFVEAAKACAAFFTLWRSSNSTSGLDDVYRKYFHGSSDGPAVDAHNWKQHPSSLNVENLKTYFRECLDKKGVFDRNNWKERSKRFLLYSEHKTLCRFVLFVACDDRVPDEQNPGLTVEGTKGSCPMLSLSRWRLKDHKSIEHVAPQTPKPGHTWDPEIYYQRKFHDIGNLILLPTDINRFVDNHSWMFKYFHYCHVGVKSKDDLKKISQQAMKQGVTLSKKATNALSKATFNCAVEPILELDHTGTWDVQMIDQRSEQIKDVVWDRLVEWLQ